MFSMLFAAVCRPRFGTAGDDSCLQIPHQLKQFLTMLFSQYVDIFVSKKRHIDQNQVYPWSIPQYFLFLLLIFCLKACNTGTSGALRA